MRTPTPSDTSFFGFESFWRGGSHSLGRSPSGSWPAGRTAREVDSIVPAVRRRRGVSAVRRRVGAHRLGGVVAGLVLVLLAGCVPAPAPPTMAEVLDGQATAQARTAAFGLVDQWVAGFGVPGVSEVARQQFLTCWEGHNDWKTHDGFRLKCEARELVYLGWDGAFESGAGSVLAKMRSVCTDPGGFDKRVDESPGGSKGPLVVGGPGFRCTGGAEVYTEFFRGPSGEDIGSMPKSYGWDEMRWTSGPRDAALWGRLETHRWILAIDVRAVFYQDAA